MIPVRTTGAVVLRLGVIGDALSFNDVKPFFTTDARVVRSAGTAHTMGTTSVTASIQAVIALRTRPQTLAVQQKKVIFASKAVHGVRPHTR